MNKSGLRQDGQIAYFIRRTVFRYVFQTRRTQLATEPAIAARECRTRGRRDLLARRSVNNLAGLYDLGTDISSFVENVSHPRFRLQACRFRDRFMDRKTHLAVENL